jgi:8-oxo-dGTP pyrophosphatase MutT (NUDIX family)
MSDQSYRGQVPNADIGSSSTDAPSFPKSVEEEQKAVSMYFKKPFPECPRVSLGSNSELKLMRGAAFICIVGRSNGMLKYVNSLEPKEDAAVKEEYEVAAKSFEIKKTRDTPRIYKKPTIEYPSEQVKNIFVSIEIQLREQKSPLLKSWDKPKKFDGKVQCGGVCSRTFQDNLRIQIEKAESDEERSPLNKVGEYGVLMILYDYPEGLTLDFPGGKRQLGETVAECAKRELMEEVGVDLNTFSGPNPNPPVQENKHQWFHMLYGEGPSGELSHALKAFRLSDDDSTNLNTRVAYVVVSVEDLFEYINAQGKGNCKGRGKGYINVQERGKGRGKGKGSSDVTSPPSRPSTVEPRQNPRPSLSSSFSDVAKKVSS